MQPTLHLGLYSFTALFLLTWGGNQFCRLVFRFTGLTASVSPDPNDPAKAGRVIGSLERLIIAIGLASGSWEVIAAVIALKTVGRFQELDNKKFAEYFLIGSLCSLLWAALITGSWIAYDEFRGVHARDQAITLLSPPEGQSEAVTQNR